MMKQVKGHFELHKPDLIEKDRKRIKKTFKVGNLGYFTFDLGVELLHNWVAVGWPNPHHFIKKHNWFGLQTMALATSIGVYKVISFSFLGLILSWGWVSKKYKVEVPEDEDVLDLIDRSLEEDKHDDRTKEGLDPSDEG